MDPHRAPEVQTLVEEALRLDRPERAQFLSRIEDRGLRVEVEAVLNSDDATCLIEPEFRRSFQNDLHRSEDSSIGPYHLLEIIGKGGMGEVWLAEQKTPVRRRVALKLIKPGMDTQEVLRRFASEFQALALMDHPGIAKVFEAGFSPQGRPFFAMEYVPGVPIAEYCNGRRLTIQQRLELMCSVCEAVQHAHQKAIIHRDLKPSNILVTDVDGKPMPKIIDFGLAKALGQQLTAATVYTSVGAVIGTPGYMSPEQALSTRDDIDTRADVYSLGVILYELLADVLPFDYSNLSVPEIARAMKNQDARTPSSKLQSLPGATATAIANNRQLDRSALKRRLRGDLDSITLKAIERDRATRYGSASELGADIARYLRDEPIAARPAGFLYRARKGFLRNKIVSLSAAAIVATIAAISFAEAVQLKRITEERNRSESTVEFITDMFKVPNHGLGPGLSITAEEILNNGDQQLQRRYARQPIVRGRLEDALARIYDNLGGSDDRARTLARDAVRILANADGPEGRETLRAKSVLAAVLYSRDDSRAAAEAAKILRDTVAAERRVLGSKNPQTLRSIAELGAISYYNAFTPGNTDFHESENLLQEAAHGEKAVLGPDDRATIATELRLVGVLDREQKYGQAEGLARELVDAGKRDDSVDGELFRVALQSLAYTLRDDKKLAEAEQAGREWQDIESRDPSDDTVAPFSARRFTLDVLMAEHKYAQAEQEGEHLVALQRNRFGPDHYLVGSTLYKLACIAARTGQRDKALSLLSEAFAHGLGRDDVKKVQADPDLAGIRNDRAFTAALQKAK